MSRSVLLQLVRDSIQEVLQAEVSIDRNALIAEHPLLEEKIPTTLKLFIKKKLRGSASYAKSDVALIDSIILIAKQAAFADSNFKPLSTSEYLACELELTLNTPEGIISQKDPAILETTSYSIEDAL